MGLLDNNKVITTPKTGLEGTNFVKVASTDSFDVFKWDESKTNRKLRLSFRNIYAWSSDTSLYLLKGDITDTPQEIEVSTTNFPNLRRNSTTNELPKIEHVIACPCYFATGNGMHYNDMDYWGGTLTRICVIFDNGQIYHNYPSCWDDYDFLTMNSAKSGVPREEMFNKFDESVVWDIAGRKNPTNDMDLVATGAYYYNPALPSRCYEFHPALNQANGYGNTVGFGATTTKNPASNGEDIGLRARFFRVDMDSADCNSFSYMLGYVTRNNYTMIGTYRSNTSKPCRICVFGTQDGGRNWFNMYEFAAQDRLKLGNSYSTPIGLNGIVLAQEGNASSGLYQVKRRTLIVPTASDKEPSSFFEYSTPVNISSIIGTSSAITVTTESAHGFSNGDAVVIEFQDNVAADNRTFDWMVNGSTTATTGGNGILFKVTSVTTNAFSLKLYVHNTETNLPVRHIHAMNRCKDGVSISCGETYPTGGWILYCPIWQSDGYDKYNVAKPSDNVFVRLNSTADSFARPLGCVIQQESDGTYCYIGNDTATIPTNDVNMPTGRTQSFKHNSAGMYKVKLEDIDDFKNKGIIKYNTPEVCYAFFDILNTKVYCGEFGALGLTKDNGESWESVQLSVGGQNLTHLSGPTYDRRFSIDNILVQLKK
jgi:hypothetical protein